MGGGAKCLGVVTHLLWCRERALPVLHTDAIKSKEYDKLFIESLSGQYPARHGIALSQLINSKIAIA